MLTHTCPSRFHRYMTVNGGSAILDKPRYDEKETPRSGHAYLVGLWAKSRSGSQGHERSHRGHVQDRRAVTPSSKTA